MSLKKKLFMLDKFLTDVRSPKERYPLADDIHGKKLGYYYFVFKEERLAVGKDQALIKKFDKNGIPINRTYIDVTDKEYVYFPISIGQMGLAVFHTWLKTQKEQDRERFMKFADWFYDNAETDATLGARWLTDVALPQYQNPGPWASAFSQSRGLSILCRAYQLSANEKYAQMARQALLPFKFEVEEGGVTAFTEWGPFYEEYTSSVPTMVLNGKIFALCGLYDFMRVFPEEPLAKQLFEEGAETLAKVLPDYDLGFWSRYNNCRAPWHPDIDPATIAYQRLHIVQLKLMYRLTEKPVFRDYMERFKKQDTTLNALRMYLLKYKSLKKIGRL